MFSRNTKLVQKAADLIGLKDAKQRLFSHTVPFLSNHIYTGPSNTLSNALIPQPHCYCLYGRAGSGKMTLVECWVREMDNMPNTRVFPHVFSPYSTTPESIQKMFENIKKSDLRVAANKEETSTLVTVLIFRSCHYSFIREEQPTVQAFLRSYHWYLDSPGTNPLVVFFLVDDTPKSLCLTMRQLVFADIEAAPLTGDERREYLKLLFKTYYAVQEVHKCKIDDVKPRGPANIPDFSLLWHNQFPEQLEILVDASEYCTQGEMLRFCQLIFYTDMIEKRDPFKHTFERDIKPLLVKEHNDETNETRYRFTEYVPKERYLPIKQFREGAVDVADVDEINERIKAGQTSERRATDANAVTKRKRPESMDLSMTMPSAKKQQ